MQIYKFIPNFHFHSYHIDNKSDHQLEKFDKRWLSDDEVISTPGNYIVRTIRYFQSNISAIPPFCKRKKS